jgi:antitoxin VapB
MAPNIKNKKAHRMAKQLARATGESITVAVSVAIRERLERVQAEQSNCSVERIMTIARECAAHMKEPFKSIDHGDLLYDEKGLPK